MHFLDSLVEVEGAFLQEEPEFKGIRLAKVFGLISYWKINEAEFQEATYFFLKYEGLRSYYNFLLSIK